MSRWQQLWRTSAQIALLAGIWLLADWAVRAWSLPLPANVTGMLALLALLLLGWVRVEWFSAGAGWLLAEMLLFFVPAAMILMQNPQMFGLLGLKLLAIIVVGTILVMAATALTIDVLFRWRQRHETR